MALAACVDWLYFYHSMTRINAYFPLSLIYDPYYEFDKFAKTPISMFPSEKYHECIFCIVEYH